MIIKFKKRENIFLLSNFKNKIMHALSVKT